MLDIQNLSKSYGSQKLFSGLDFRLGPGDRVGLVGPNGAGKTTLLRVIVGLEQPDDGVIVRQKELQVGYLPQDVLRAADTSVLTHVMSGRADLVALAQALEASQAQLSSTDAGDTAGAVAAAASHAELFERYQHFEVYALEGRAREILTGLGLRDDQLDLPLGALSGGFGMRVELARLLLAQPSLLLLDEPTNHLDIKSLDWLEGFLADYPGAWLVVSHDRYFLNRMVTSIAELTQNGVLCFPGNYDDYVEARDALSQRLAAEQAGLAKRMAELQVFIDRFGSKASKARQAQSRVKQVEKLARVAAAAQQDAPPPSRARRQLHLELPAAPRSGETVMTVDAVHKKYGDAVVYGGLDLVLRRGERVALVGENGAGKSTLLKMLAGVLTPDSGTLRLGHGVETYYFAQHQTEALDPRKTVLEELRALLPSASETRVRGLLGAFLFSAGTVDKKTAVLSGGEKSRLVLAKMLAQPANFLLLDEPTNHLDLAARDVVEGALGDFGGTLCFISHDRYFVNRLATRVVEIRAGGRVTEFAGNYDYYLWKRGEMDAIGQDGPPESSVSLAQSSSSPSFQAVPAGSETTTRATREQERNERKASQRQASRRAKQQTVLEGEIEQQETRLRELDACLCDPTVHADGERVRTLTQERQAIAARLPVLYAEWEQVAS
jgi:ATP-binding cassette subfamily F protein 3